MDLRLGGPQIAILAVFSVIAVGFALLLLVVALRSRGGPVAPEEFRERAYRLRKRWLLLLAATLASALAALSFVLPYASGGENVVAVRVVGGQFYWSLSPEDLSRGQTILFEVTAADVNHGFGLYTPDGRLLGSVQVMPGYTNRLRVTLEQAGTYTVACLEYCGLDHHVMIRELEVREA